ncbi:sterol desaturase family protein [Flavivirga algicola]|uniref:Sterol desaturase family protein n=1 Tax=Flavivirga algicola TaxID=2729136 RepID=A0ABX1S0Y1_9FLAO|nr:sterol desaturase family protein [Flavivirga algicola]NMH89532.1 sterol desaturase family protein [Flavivirga algicola]
METLIDIFVNKFLGTVDWTIDSILFKVPWYTNYFWGLVFISIAVWGLEIVLPWRKEQAIFRKGFWTDTVYMFFNFFVFTIIISGFYAILEQVFLSLGITMTSVSLVNMKDLPIWQQLLIFFLVSDFMQWFTHVLLHRFNFLWRFHKVHHSVKEMGFAAHLRYHWMENIFYKPLKIFAVMLLGGFEPEQAFIVHFIAIAIGHFNHANIKLTYGPFKYIFNNPVMHLYHHAYALPKKRSYGVNFGISLSLWDYIFKTNYIPETSGNLTLGYSGDIKMPKNFFKQLFYGFRKNH